MKIQRNNLNDDYDFYINFDTLNVMYAPIDEIDQFSKMVSRCSKECRLVLNEPVLVWLTNNFGEAGNKSLTKTSQYNDWAVEKPGYNAGSVVLYMNEEVAMAFKMRWL